MLVLSMSCGRKMKNAPIFYKNGNRNCKGLGYDLQMNFSKFLREARSHADAASLRQMETAKMRGTRKKKTWIRALSLFFNCRQKKSEEEEEEAPLKAKALKLSGVEQRPWLSGRLFGNGSKFGQLRHKMGLSSSGPLSFCFTPAMAEETEVPYRSLGHQSHARRAQAFGPIYLKNYLFTTLKLAHSSLCVYFSQPYYFGMPLYLFSNQGWSSSIVHDVRRLLPLQGLLGDQPLSLSIFLSKTLSTGKSSHHSEWL